MKFVDLSKEELITRIENLESELSKLKSINEKQQTNKKPKWEEEATKKGEEPYKGFFNTGPTATFVWKVIDNDFILSDINEASQIITERKASDFIGMKASSIYFDLPFIIEKLNECYSTKKIIEFEYFYKNRFQGTSDWVEFRLAFIEPDIILLYANVITWRKNAEEALKKSEAKYRHLVETASDPIYLISENGIIIDTNQSALDILGVTRNEIVGQTVEFVDPNYSVDKFLGFWKEIPFNKQIIFESTHQHKNGHLIPVELSTKKYKLEGQTFYYGIARDIRERKMAESKLIQNNANLNALIENTNDFIWSIDREYKLLTANSSFLYHVEPIYNERLSLGALLLDTKKLTPELYQEWKNTYDKVLLGEKIKADLETDLRPENKRHLELNYNPILNEKKEVTGVSVFGRDVTEQKLAEQKIIETKQFYENIIEGVQDGIWVSNENDVIYFANAAMEQIAGIPREEIQGKNVFHDFSKETTGELISFYEKAKTEKKPVWYSIKVKTPAGRDTWQNGWLIPKFKNKRFNGIICTIRDITEHKLAQEAIKTSEERYRGFIDNLRAGVVVHSADTSILLNNKKASELLGLSDAQLKGKKAFDPDWNFTDINNRILPLGEYPVNLIQQTKKPIKDYIVGVNRPVTNDKVWLIVNGFPVFEKSGNLSEIVISFIDFTSRKQAEDELVKAKEVTEESEQRLKLASRSAQLGIWDWNVKENKLVWDERMFQLYGIKKTESVNTVEAWTNGLHPEDKERAITECNEALAGHKQFNTVFRVLHPDGKVLFIKGDGLVIKDAEGQAERMIGVNRDITEMKLNELELRNAKEQAESSNANITAIIEGTNNSIWAFDNFYRILYINHTFQQEFLQSFGVLLQPGMNLVESLPEMLQPFWKPRYDRVLNNEQFTVEDAVPTEKGTLYIEVTFNPIVKNGKVIGGSCFGADITSRKLDEIELIKAKENAEESERKLLEAQELSHVGNWEYFAETDLVIWSKELYNIFERSYDLPAPKYSEQAAFYTKESFALLDKALHDCVQHEIPYEIGLDIYTSSGSIKHIISKGNVKKDEHNKIIGSYGTAQDITAQKQLELELVKAKEKAEESDRLKSAFLANMSHEIRTPMNGILGFTSLLKEPGLTGEDQKRFIEIIEKSGNRMLSTVNDIIDISKIEAGQVDVILSEINLNKQMDELLEFFLPEARKKNIQLSVTNRVPEQQANFISDKEKLNSILTNFIKNAIKFTHSGSIEFGYSILEKNKQNELKFFVKDSGIGIPKERLNAIFNRFEQADIEDRQVFEGSGLGLAISKAYVEMLGGKIWVESELGVGSQFYFTIPYKTIHNEIPKNNTDESNKLSQVNGKLKILIVDDDDFTITFLKEVLKEFAQELIIAKTGIEAVNLCRENKNIDVILMDIKIPGLNGYEATQKIREFNQAVFIVAQTAHAQTGDREKSIQAGCNDYISKPINKEKLLEIISRRF